MKKTFSLLLALCLLLSLAACGGESAQPTQTTAAPTETTAAPTEATTPQSSLDALNGKKIIFIGNSYTYFGKVVLSQGAAAPSQKDRTDNRGLFYYLCKEKGIDVTVTNWTFGGHDITDSMGNSCTVEKECFQMDHLSYLTDPAFDYVCIQPYFEAEYAGDIMTHLQPTLDFFRQANPDVKFLLLVPHMAFVKKFVWRGELQAAVDAGITVVNWGGMLDDLVNKAVTIPESDTQFFKASFVVSIDKQDGHHQNLLAGYLTALMTYCAITGESAVGQPYAFADDSSLSPHFDMEKFQKENYVYEPFTNFVEIYRSETDMLGLQQLVDQYILK